ncbi:hypothetical protein AVEN_244969-1 [Araneus ventricosus]|uniref:Uncharacterized protein n=1 Tax=Araneus ventricosus TaxID=182803 RepID=A0A4Y2F5P5_ARAVE|nr:hypothetical protein AVEN_244969-1 [Araneus ventricosus]
MHYSSEVKPYGQAALSASPICRFREEERVFCLLVTFRQQGLTPFRVEGPAKEQGPRIMVTLPNECSNNYWMRKDSPSEKAFFAQEIV